MIFHISKMNNIFEITKNITFTILFTGILNVEYLTLNFVRNAIGTLNGGILIPDDRVLRGTNTAEYINKLMMQNLSGIGEWLKLIETFISLGFEVDDLDWEGVHALLFLLGFNSNSLQIPCIEIIETPGHTACRTTMCSAEEYCITQKLKSFRDFVEDLIEIVLYGFPMRPGMVISASLGISNLPNYISARLFQGTAELIINSENMTIPYMISNFLNSDLLYTISQVENRETDELENMKLMHTIQNYVTTSDSNKRMRIERDMEAQAAKVLTASTFYLSDTPESVLEIAARFKFAGDVGAYSEYLTRNRIGATMGYDLWKSVAFAETSGDSSSSTGSLPLAEWWNREYGVSVKH